MNPDIALFRFINIHGPLPFLDSFMVFMTNKAYILYLFFLIIAIFKDRKRSFFPFFLLIISWLLADSAGNILKNAIERPRPFLIIEDARLLVGKGTSFSFPSNHAATYGAGATILWYFFKYLRLPAFIIALLVAVSRIYVGVHYPSDVLAGAVLGVSIALSITALFKKIRDIYLKDRYRGIFFIILFFLLIGRLYYIHYGPLDLSGDEAHYWEWSRRPDLSYYSKGPLIAYLIGLSTFIAGNTEFGVRFLAPFFLFFSSLIIYRLTNDLYEDSRVSVLSGLLIQFIPLFSTYGVIMTIDSPFIFFWSLSLYLFKKALDSGKFLWWSGLGISTGLGLLAKYSMAFFFISGLIFLILHREKRIFLKTPFPYITLLISTVVFCPVIIWNIKNNFVTLRHTAGHVGVYEGLGLRPVYFLEFVGSQLGVVTPLFFIVILISVIDSFLKNTLSIKERFLLSFGLPEIAFFLLKSLQAKVQANWALMAYHTLFIFSAAWFIKNQYSIKKGIKLLIFSSFILILLLFPFIHFPEIFNLPVKLDPSSRLRGWEELGKKITTLSREMKEAGPYFIVSDRYQVSSLTAFYTEGNPFTYCVNLGRRMNQYDLWPGFHDLVHYNAIFVTIGDHKGNEFLRRFSECKKEVFMVKERIYSIFRCFDFKGMEKENIFERY